MIRVITYGTFDMLHIGHVRLLKRLKAMGDHLTVAVSTDAFVGEKGKKPVVPFEERIELIANLACVDHVIPEQSWDQKQVDIASYEINILGMGSDWEGKFDYLTPLCRVVYLPRTPDISSSELRRRIADRS